MTTTRLNPHPRFLPCAGLCLAVMLPSAHAGNLVNDGAFEQNTLQWTSSRATLTLDPLAAAQGKAGMKISSPYAGCAVGAVYNLNPADFQNGTLYEFGARTRLASTVAGASVRLTLKLIRNGTEITIDGEQSSYDAKAYSEKWTRAFGVYKADFAATDTLKLCIGASEANKPLYVDDVFIKPLTTQQVQEDTGYQPPTTLNATNRIYADGNRLVIGTAKTPFLLKGINVYLYDPGNDTDPPPAWDDFKYKNADAESYAEISRWGFNTVRLMLSYNLFESNTNPGVYKEEGWALLNRHIAWAKQNNIRLILDMHVPPGGYQSTNNTGFGSSDALKKRLEDLWVAIATRYKNETTIAAYDLINEPHVNNWFAYAQTLINKIRSVDTNHLIDVEVSFHTSDKGMFKLEDNNILYDVHWYEPWSWAGSHTNNTPYTGTLEQFKQLLRKGEGLSTFYNVTTDQFTVPINIGEYGLTFEKYELVGVNGVTWLQHAHAAFDYFGIHRQLFHYNENNFGVYRSWNSYPNEHSKTTEPLKAAFSSTINIYHHIYDRILNWAEYKFPSLLNRTQANQTLTDGTVYRCYPTGICTGYRQGRVLVFDGRQLLDVGADTDFLRLVVVDGF